jgi:hypothetical protein
MLVTSGRRTAAATAVAAAALIGVSACGSGSSSSGSSTNTSKETPAQAAQAGFTGLAGQNAVTSTLKLDITPADLVALSADDGSKGLTTAEANVIAGGTIVIAAKSNGSSFASDAKSGSTSGEQVALSVNGGGASNLFQLVVTGKTLYARADVSEIAMLAGADTSELDQIGAEAPAQYSFIKDALAGKWLKVDLTQLESLAKQDASSTGASAQPTVAPSQIAALEGTFTKIFQTDVTVTRAAVDPTLGDHLVLTGNSRTVGTDLVTALKSSFTTIPGASQAFAEFKPASIPSKNVTIDEYVKNGQLSALKLNLNQFFDATDAAAAKGTDSVEIDFTDSATIAAPATATNVDLSGLSGLLGSLGGGSGL